MTTAAFDAAEQALADAGTHYWCDECQTLSRVEELNDALCPLCRETAEARDAAQTDEDEANASYWQEGMATARADYYAGR
jgi:hypothetical protein